MLLWLSCCLSASLLFSVSVVSPQAIFSCIKFRVGSSLVYVPSCLVCVPVVVLGAQWFPDLTKSYSVNQHLFATTNVRDLSLSRSVLLKRPYEKDWFAREIFATTRLSLTSRKFLARE